MSIPTVIALLTNGATKLYRKHAQSRRNAEVMRYLAEMPAYLRHDIGLPPDADLSQVVGRDRPRRTLIRKPVRALAGTQCPA